MNVQRLPRYQLHDRLGYRVSRLSKLMQARLEKGLARHGMNRLKWCALSGVALEGVSSPSDLADHIGITRPATSRLLKALQKEGLIRRTLDAEDGRSRQIEVTGEGRARIDLCYPLVEENQDYFLRKLDGLDHAALWQGLDALLEGEVGDFDNI